MSAAADYRAAITEAANKYGPTPGGAPPGEIIEAYIQAQSGGDLRATDSNGGRGLALIDPKSDAWKWYLESDLVNTYGSDPNALYEPAAAIAVATLALDRMQEDGLTARAAGDPGAWADWMGAGLGLVGWVANDGSIEQGNAIPQKLPNGMQMPPISQAVYDFKEMLAYVKDQFGDDRMTAIDAMNAGTFQPTREGTLEYQAGRDRDHNPDSVGKTIGDAVSSTSDAVRDLIGQAGTLAARAGIFIVGALLALTGAYFLFRS